MQTIKGSNPSKHELHVVNKLYNRKFYQVKWGLISQIPRARGYEGCESLRRQLEIKTTLRLFLACLNFSPTKTYNDDKTGSEPSKYRK